MRRPVLILLAVSAPVVLLLAGCEPTDADVAMKDSFFDPGTTTVARGGRVHWTNEGFQTHTSTSDAPLALWSSGSVGRGGTHSTTFLAGGTYPYHCEVHFGMVGTVKVPMAVSPASGTTSTTFTLRVASAAAPSGFQYVVQKRDPGGSFQAFRTLTAATTTFQATRTGTFQFRSRLRRTTTGAASGFSDPASITVS